MLPRTDDVIQSVLAELKRHPALSALDGIAPAIHEFSPRAMHFSAREISTGRQAVIKVDVDEAEIYWTVQLTSAAPDLFPALLAADHLVSPSGSGRIGFIAWERLPHTLIGPNWEGRQVDLMLDAAARFYQAARTVEPLHLPCCSWDKMRRELEEGCRKNPPGDWRRVLAHAEQDQSWLSQAFAFEVCHGDLHVGNALTRTAPPNGPALLIDLNPVLQPWIFDAAWVEVCQWKDLLRRGPEHTVQYLADRRLALGLDVPPVDVLEKAGRIALSWFAIRSWDPDHLEFMPGFEKATETHVTRGALLHR